MEERESGGRGGKRKWGRIKESKRNRERKRLTGTGEGKRKF